jgi:hypothetical protein
VPLKVSISAFALAVALSLGLAASGSAHQEVVGNLKIGPLVADIAHVFLKKPGPSLRHAVAHGLLQDSSVFTADAIYACWLIFRLCCAPLFAYKRDLEIIIA